MQRTNISGSPYFDDYDETKQFHRILFKPAPVQARELNQLQSLTMSQIERLGTHLFTEGSMVIPGSVKVIVDQSYTTITFAGGSTIADILNRDNLYITKSTNGLTAKVSKVIPATATDAVTLFLDYTASGSDQQKIFANGDALTLYVQGSPNTNVASATGIASGLGTWIKVNEGVYYVRGMLVRTPTQDFVVSKYSGQVSARLGFRVVESIVTATDDTSLLSNAQGYSNFAAPGADRLKIDLVLASLDLTATDPDFLELARVENGQIQSQIEDTSYNLIEKALAQRTYETNGDYTVSPFGIEVKEHLLSGNNGGLYALAEGGDITKAVASIKPGVGYVKGYRVENIGTVNIAIDKARDTALLNNGVISSDYGPYIKLTNVASLPDIDIKKKIRLLDVLNNDIGYFRIRAMTSDGSQWRAYFFDLTLNQDKFLGDVRKIRYTDGSNLFTADLVDTLVYGANKSNIFFKLPIDAVKTLINGGVNDTVYTVMRSFTVTTNGSGVATCSVASNETFLGVDSTNYLIGLTGASTSGTLFDAASTTTLTGTPVGSSITINLGVGQAGQTIRVIAPVSKSGVVQKTKTLTTVTNEAVTFTNQTIKNLAHADIYSLTSAIDANTGEDVTSLFTLDNGQRPGYYQVGAISTDTAISRVVNVSYQYFAHSSGDYFSADSYGGLERSLIPSFGGYNLADTIDFRPLKDASGDFTSATITGEIVRPNDTIRADITYYLPRIDIICVDSNGAFFDVRGLPSLSPTTPVAPDNSMKLYELYIPAYTNSASDIHLTFVENKRYTMRDIGKLETRIQNVEYYTSLNALETKTNSTQIIDPVTGNNRFKNGFAVDGFTNYNMADISDPEWAASLDNTNGVLNPQFMENGSDMDETSVTLTNTVHNSNVYMKTYTETPVITQPYATRTINVNPFAVFVWAGSIKLTPTTDFWKDVKYLDPVIINNVYNFRGNAVEGTVWSSWTGYETIATGVSRWDIQPDYDIYNVTDVTQRATTISTSNTTTFGSVTTQSVQDNFLGNSIIPYMRSIDIAFECKGFKPWTQLYGFWDTVSISQDITPNGGVKGGALVTDATGYAKGIFTVPCTSDRKFRTGTSSMRFSDTVTNDTVTEDSYGETTFQSGGSVDTRQQIVTNTTVLTASTTTSTTTSTAIVQGQIREKIGHIDPIAQTFLVPTSGGAFISKFDIFFATKSTSIPIVMQLRTVSTGFPTSTVLAEVTLDAANVVTSTDATVPTSFVFDDPVYLEDNAEYAIVLMANSQDYTVYISQMGEAVIGQQMAVSKQPNLGVFLTSSNSTTWNANQLQDLKFTMYRAVFDTNPSIAVFNSKSPIALPLSAYPFATTSGSGNVVASMKSHGLKAGDIVKFTGAQSGNGFLDTDINNVNFTVTNSTIDSFTFVVGKNATLTGSFGGNVVLATANYPFSKFLFNSDFVNFSGTATKWEYRYKGQSSRTFSDWIQFDPKSTVDLSSEGVLTTGSDFQVRVTMTTGSDNLSPCVSDSALTTIFVSTRVNSDAANPVYEYVTNGIIFNNPSTSATFYVGAKLPNSSSMKFYYKKMDSVDQDLSTIAWTELQPTTPLVNDMKNFLEYTYKMSATSFVGYKIKIVLLSSDPVNYPTLKDFRSIALA